jgi:predicted GH43/DUF377 family glycosyl hydrolase
MVERTANCTGKCWHTCEEGHGVEGRARPGIECAGCEHREDDEPPTRLIRFDEKSLFPHLGGKRFNPSLIEHGDGYLFAYRNGWANCEIWLCRLDKRFLPIGEPWKLDLSHPAALFGQEDPRFFWFRDRLHLSFVGTMESNGRVRITNQLYARLTDDLRVAEVFHPSVPGRSDWEKNHVYFQYMNALYAIYDVAPNHRLLRIDGDVATWAESTPNPLPWSGGPRRGGATPVLRDDEYYHWFHSRSYYGKTELYEIGVMTFEAKPPFRPLRGTREPVMVAKPGPKGKPQSIFPCGAVLNGGRWLISMGLYDSYIEIHAFDAAEIESRLLPGNAG